MKRSLIVTIAVSIVLLIYAFGCQGFERTGKIRVGTYDNRAIAIAYSTSKYNPAAEKMTELKKAEAVGDTARVRELNEWGPKMQRQLHRQGFCRVPVDDLLTFVKDKFPEVAAKTGVDLISMQCDYTGADIEIIDITHELVALFEPSDQALNYIEETTKTAPLDLDELRGDEGKD